MSAGALLVASLVGFGVSFATLVGVGLYVVTTYPSTRVPRRNRARYTGTAFACLVLLALSVVAFLIAFVAILRGAA